MAKVIRPFYDRKDNNRYYGVTFPYNEYHGDREQELIKLGYLEGETVVEETKPDLTRLKVTELKELAKERNIEGYSEMKKAELIEALK